jgi:hypothetical protein
MTTARQVPPAVKPEEIAEWRHHPATKAFLHDLEERVDEGKETWATQGLQRETAIETAIANAKALGGMQVLQTLIGFLKGEE